MTERKDGTLLSPKARDAVKRIHGRAKKSGWSSFGIESWESSKSVRKVLVEPSRKLFDSPRIQGGTSVLAHVIKAGGDVGRRRAEIKLPDARRINAQVKTQDLTEKLGHLLYQTVELTGHAVYNSQTIELVELEIRAIGTFAGSDPIEAVQQLPDLGGGGWEGVKVVDRIEDFRNGIDDE